jgi:acetyltransferase-like isoleucine patch superfamily enzyme
MNLAPIVLFVYNRPEHTRKTLEALRLNDLASESILYIYADGAKQNASNKHLEDVAATRKVIKEQLWCGAVHIIESKVNRGLAVSITEGVTEVVERYGRVIVLEDDIVTSKGFLVYMNDALRLYEKNERVMHISGYMYPYDATLPETFFFNVPLCWGWATWKRAWVHYNNDAVDLWMELIRRNLFNEFDKFGGNYLSSQLGENITGRLNTWFIKWHSTVLLKEGFTLYPKYSLVENIGFDNTGVHNGNFDEFTHEKLLERVVVEESELIENHDASEIILNFYNKLHFSSRKIKPLTFKGVIKKIGRKVLFKFIPELKELKRSSIKLTKRNSYTGKNVKLYSDYRLTNSVVGDYTYVAENSMINNTVIGKFCSIGPNLFCGWGIHPTTSVSTHPMFFSTLKQNGITLSATDKFLELKPIKIGNDVFIGMNVTILDGVTIGDGAVIGAGAVVSKDIPPYAIAVGVPIQIIKYRFASSIIDELLRIKWWDFKFEKLQLVETAIFNVEDFLRLNDSQ